MARSLPGDADDSTDSGHPRYVPKPAPSHSYLRRTTRSGGWPSRGPMGRVWRWGAAYGLDVLVVAAAIVSAIGTAVRDDVDRPDGVQLWFEVVALSVALLALC